MNASRPKIMLVDDNPANLAMGKSILAGDFEVYPMPSAQKLFLFLEKVTPALILLDVEMPDLDGYETIRRLKADAGLADIPVVFLTSNDDEANEIKGLELGAVDYVTKPFSAPRLLRSIKTQLLIASQRKELDGLAASLREREEMIGLRGLQDVMFAVFSDLMEFRDAGFGGHAVRIKKYLEILGGAAIRENVYPGRLSARGLDILARASQLHDLGKIAVDDALLGKPGKFTPDEFEAIKRHVSAGVSFIELMERSYGEHAMLRCARIVAETHHEKWDGSGYPNSLGGDAIPLEGRLMAIADVYDALVSPRNYRPALTTKEAEAAIRRGRGRHFDPALVDVFDLVARDLAEIAEAGRI